VEQGRSEFFKRILKRVEAASSERPEGAPKKVVFIECWQLAKQQV